VDPLILLVIGMIVVLGSILGLRLHPFLALFLGALIVGSLTTGDHLRSFGASQSPSWSEAATADLIRQPVGGRIADAFGGTLMGLGLLIALASLIGKALLDSGGADRIVRSSMRLLGERRAPLGFLGSGYLLGIPVFFDTVFYLLIPLAKAMGTRNERKYTLYVMCIVAGTTMTHSLVPPTPGPLYAAQQLNIDLGLMIVCGLVVGAFTSMAGYGYARWANRRWPIPLRETPDLSLAELKALAAQDDRQLPPFWLAILPILLPLVLIAGYSIVATLLPVGAEETPAMRLFANLGDKNIALAIAAVIALGTLAWRKRTSRGEMAKAVESALLNAGTIILITAMGGAFGAMLQQAAVGPRIQELAVGSHHWVLPLAFVVTALIRSAQGSATVSMYTAVPILAVFADPAVLGCHPVWLALAIGCGSKPFPWMNDSGFWVICRMAGLTEGETLKTTSMTIAVEGLVGLPVVIVMARLFPLLPA
jgi:gluconate:H+ symporter, GntP family